MVAIKNQYVPRVNQIDVIALNNDITRLIRDNILENLQAVFPKLFSKIQPELDLIVQTAIWLGSIGKCSSTFGQQLLVLSYDPERLTMSKLALHYCLTILPTYIKSIEERRLGANFDWLRNVIEWGESTVLTLSIINFFRFLKTGRKPTLVDFLLGLDYISLRHNQRREIGYKYLTRELLWGGFMEILGLLLPLINFRKLQRQMNVVFKKRQKTDSIESNTVTDIKPKVLSTTTCAYCGERPTLPHHMGCEHVYCYYCLAANICTDSKFCCVKCDKNESCDGFKMV